MTYGINPTHLHRNRLWRARLRWATHQARDFTIVFVFVVVVFGLPTFIEGKVL